MTYDNSPKNNSSSGHNIHGVSNEIYEPREDTFLLKECVEKFAAGKVLEIGTGSGLLALTAADMVSVDSVVAVDINPKSIRHVKSIIKKEKPRNELKVFISDLFQKVDGKFDTVIFNPPYLPNDKRVKDVALDGGKNGYELITRFLCDVNNYLTTPGVLLLLFSSFTKKEKVDTAIDENCLSSSLIAHRKMDFETLYVYRVEKSALLRELEVAKVSSVRKFARGKRGIIFKGIYEGSKVAIKAKNPNSESHNAIEREYRIIDFLRNEGFENIPKILFTGKEFFVYEFIEGLLIEEFLKKSKKKEIIEMLKDIMKSMRMLDVIGVNKEEMHHPHKHILISGKSFKLIDFERCKETDKPHNVTQFCQFILSENFNRSVSKKKLSFDRTVIMKLATAYKRTYSEKSFQKILDCII